MISVVIEADTGLPTMNVQIEPTASAEDLRAAWEEASSGMLQRHMRDAIWFECVRREIDPREVIHDPPPLS